MSWSLSFEKTAMFVEGKGDTIIAYRDKIFRIFQNKTSARMLRKIESFLGLPRQADGYELTQTIRDNRPDVLVAADSENALSIDATNFAHGTGSRLLQNVLKTIGPRVVKYTNMEGEVYRTHDTHEITGELPTVFYHGTSSDYATKILRFGLMPRDTQKMVGEYSETNFQNIEHYDIVFITSDLQKAEFHAETTCNRSRAKGSSWRDYKNVPKQGFPVIFEIRLPDPNLLVPDYDIDKSAGELSTQMYDDIAVEHPRSEQINEDPFAFSKKAGVFGYRGRIPANHITKIFVKTQTEETYAFDADNWFEASPAQLQQAIEFGDASAATYELDPTCPECGEILDDPDSPCEYCQENNQELKTAIVKQVKQNRDGEFLTLQIADTDRYTSDQYFINVSLTRTKRGHSIGFQVNNAQLGIAGYVEYWHYKKDQLKLARKTFQQIKTVITEIAREIEYDRPPMCNIAPMCRSALQTIDSEHKEKSGVRLYNSYVADQTKGSDYRQLIYGNRYNNHEPEHIGNNWTNIDDKSRQVEHSGDKRSKQYRYKYASRITLSEKQQNMLHKILTTTLGVFPPMVGLFLTWLVHNQNMTPEQFVQVVNDNPQQAQQIVGEFNSQEQGNEVFEEPEVAQPESSAFEDALSNTLALEGGYVNNPADPGGETNYGITRKKYVVYLQNKGLPSDQINMRNIPQEHVKDMYLTMYWQPSGADYMPPVLAGQVFDCAVHSGPDKAVKFLQQLLKIPVDGQFGSQTQQAMEQYIQTHGEVQLANEFLKLRQGFLAQLAQKHPKFKHGWENRMRAMQQEIANFQ